MSIVDKLKRAAELGAPIVIHNDSPLKIGVRQRDGIWLPFNPLDPERLTPTAEWLIIGALVDYLTKHYEPNQLNVELNASVHYGYSALIDAIGLHAEVEHDTSLLEATLDAFIEAVEGDNGEGKS